MEKFSEQEVLQQMQACQLDILKTFKKVCDANNLRFYLAFGTCLGAIRHHGFIPWDDDIDVFMRLEDINKLVQLQDQFPPNLFIQTHEKEPEYGLLMPRIRNSSTTLIEADHVDRDINQGVYIDIYPLFYCEENKWRMKIMLLKTFLCRLFVYNAPPANKGRLTTFVAKVVLKLVPDWLKKRVADGLYEQLINRSKSRLVADFPDISRGKIYQDEWFGTPVYGDFEGEQMPLPSDPHAFLAYEYGDYMQLPPEDKQHIHHHYLFADFDHSYLNYKGIKYCVNKKS